MPLLYQPGTRWVYSVSVDIQGYLVEKLSGKTFPEFLRTRIFEPLGMVDTGVLRAGREAVARGDHLRVRQGEGRTRAAPGEITGHEPAGTPVRRRWPVRHRGGLLPLRADAAQRRRARTASASSRRASVDMMRTNVLSDAGAQLEVGHRPGAVLAGAGLRLRLRGRARSRRGEAAGRQGQLLVVGHRRHVVLDRSDQRRRRSSASSSGAAACPGAANHEDVSRRVIAEALTKQ